MIQRIVIGVVLGVIIVALLGAGAYAIGMQAYNVGYVSGQTVGDQAVAPDANAAPQSPWGGPYIHRGPFVMGPLFGFLPCLGVMLIMGLVCMLLRGMFWHRHWGMHRHGNGAGPCTPFGPWGKGTPPAA